MKNLLIAALACTFAFAAPKKAEAHTVCLVVTPQVCTIPLLLGVIVDGVALPSGIYDIGRRQFDGRGGVLSGLIVIKAKANFVELQAISATNVKLLGMDLTDPRVQAYNRELATINSINEQVAEIASRGALDQIKFSDLKHQYESMISEDAREGARVVGTYLMQ